MDAGDGRREQPCDLESHEAITKALAGAFFTV